MFQSKKQDTTVGWVLNVLGGAIVLLVVGASYFFGFAEFSNQQQAQQIRIQQLNDLLLTAPSVHQTHLVHHEELDQITQLTNYMHSRLPSSLQRKPFEDAVSKIASKVGFFRKSMSWSSPKVSPSHSSVKVTISGHGSYASICKFLFKTSQLTRITKVSRLALTSAQDSQQYPTEITFVLVYGVDSHDTEEKGETL